MEVEGISETEHSPRLGWSWVRAVGVLGLGKYLLVGWAENTVQVLSEPDETFSIISFLFLSQFEIGGFLYHETV